MNRRGVLFSAGMITGEALMGILMAFPIVLFQRADVLALPPALQFGQWLGVLVLAVLALWLYRTSTSIESPTPRSAPGAHQA